MAGKTTLDEARSRWRKEVDRAPQRDVSFDSISGRQVQLVYTAEDVEEGYDDEQLGLPGQFPFTRGVHATLYRSKLWTMRQFAGFGTPEETNARFKFLLSRGLTGLSTAFDLPTLMGVDSDHPTSLGEVGRLGEIGRAHV